MSCCGQLKTRPILSIGFNRDIAKPAHNIGRDFGLKHFFSAPITCLRLINIVIRLYWGGGRSTYLCSQQQVSRLFSIWEDVWCCRAPNCIDNILAKHKITILIVLLQNKHHIVMCGVSSEISFECHSKEKLDTNFHKSFSVIAIDCVFTNWKLKPAK